MEENKLIVFNVGEEFYGIDIKKVMGIEKKQEIITVPNTPDCIKGIINLRGDVIPIYSFRTKFNKEELSGDDEGMLIITKTGDITIGFEVDQVAQIMDITGKKVEKPPIIIVSDATNYIDKIVEVSNSTVGSTLYQNVRSNHRFARGIFYNTFNGYLLCKRSDGQEQSNH